VADTVAYRKFVSEAWEQPHASSLFVVLHNVVTKSIARKWFPGGRGSTYRYPEVVSQLSGVVGLELPATNCSDQARKYHLPGFD